MPRRPTAPSRTAAAATAVTAASTPNPTAFDLQAVLFAPDGESLAGDSDSSIGFNPRIAITAPGNGVYQLDLGRQQRSGFSAGGAYLETISRGVDVGAYRLQVCLFHTIERDHPQRCPTQQESQ